MTSNDRLAALDGLRGWASLSVVVYHYCWETFGILYPEFRSFVPALLGNGDLAVAIFFTLSGYVLTLRRWGRTDNGILPLVLLRRYVRLAIPVMGAVLLVWLAMSLGLNVNKEAGAVVNRPDWLGAFATFQPDLLQAIWFGAARVYWIPPLDNYGPFLWTMIVELAGSIFVLTLSHWSRNRWVSYIVLIAFAVLMNLYFTLASCVFLGAIIARLQTDGVIFSKAPGSRQSFVSTVILGAALVTAALLKLQDDTLSRVAVAMLGTVVFVGVARSRWASNLMVTPLSRWLGQVSFPLYLMQYLILIVPSSWLILVVSDAGLLSPWSAVGIAVFGLAATIAAAWAFMPVEHFTLKAVHAIGAWTRRSTLSA